MLGESIRVGSSAPSSATSTDASGDSVVAGAGYGNSNGICEGIGVTSRDGVQEGCEVGRNDGSSEGMSVGRVDGNSVGISVGNSDGSCDGLSVGSRDGSGVGDCEMPGVGTVDGSTLAPSCESGGQLAPPSKDATVIARERMRLLFASQAAQTSQPPQEVTTQSTGQVSILHTEFSCVSVHELAVPSSKMSRLRYRMPALQEVEHALHCCKTTHTESRLSGRTQTLMAHTCHKAVRQSWPCTGSV